MSSDDRADSKLMLVLFAAVIVLLAACGYLFWRYQQVSDAQSKTVAAQTARLTAKLGTTISLPREEPTLATVLNKDKLGDQQLAAEARNGDQLLIYPKTRRVILYRPSTDRVIDMFHLEATQVVEK